MKYNNYIDRIIWFGVGWGIGLIISWLVGLGLKGVGSSFIFGLMIIAIRFMIKK